MPIVQQITTTVAGVTLTPSSYANPVTVTSAGTVTGGIYASQTWAVANDGSIGGTGIFLEAGGSVTNNAVITGQTGVYLGGAGVITNAGTGALIQGVSGVVTGSAGAVTVTNFGTIAGTGGTAIDFRSAQDVLVVEAGSRLIGSAEGDGGRLEFGSAGGAGTIAGLGNGESYSGFGTYEVDAGAAWTLTGSSTISAGTTFTDAGNLMVAGTLDLIGTLVNTDVLAVTGSLVNSGSIDGNITLSGGGQVTNQAGATISAPSSFAAWLAPAETGTLTNYGVMSGATGADIASGAVENAGTILATGYGIDLTGTAASVVNRAGALISGQFGGVSGIYGTVVNAGTIDGRIGYGIVFSEHDNFVSNSASGLIEGDAGGIDTNGTVVNAGHVTNGIYLNAPQAAVINRAGGLIEGLYGVTAYRAGVNTITNFGTIIGTGGTAVRLQSSGDVLVVGAGSSLIGTVAGGGGTLAFAGTGTESGIGSTILTGSAPGTFIGFSTYLLQAGANWTFAGPSTVGSGETLVDAGTLTVATALTAAGQVTVGGSLINDGSIGGSITLTAGGHVTNETNAAISATGIALYGAVGNTVAATNDGTILSQSFGVEFLGSGDVTNAAGALISGQMGVASSMLDNAGTISGSMYGVVSPPTEAFNTPLNVVNRTGGLISGNFYGVHGSGTVVNAGTITSADGGGVYLGTGFISNSAGGFIQGSSSGVLTGATVDNAGTIQSTVQSGGAAAVDLVQNGGLINRSSGVIVGQRGVWDNSQGQHTVTNYGTIIGNTGTAVALTAVNDVLEIEAGSTLVGSAIGAGGTLLLGAGGGAGTISEIGTGTDYSGFAHYGVEAGADWTFSGINTIAKGDTLNVAGTLVVTGSVSIASGASLTAGGVIIVNGGVLTDQTSIGGTNPTIDVTGQGTVTLGPPPAGALLVDFTGPGLLTLGSVNGVTIKDFTAGDAIGLAPVGYKTGATATYDSSSHALTLTSGGSRFVFQTENFILAPGDHLTVVNNAGHAQIEEIPCFLRGTQILTQHGEVAVEDLAVGDRVVTLSGQARPIVWIGTGRTRVRPGQRSASTPIRVRKGALADNVPNRDLLITKGHSLFLDGVLIPAEYLVNHRSIRWDDEARTVEYYHIELAAHEVLLANGAAAESYRDDGNRDLFANANSFWGQPPKPPCAPVLTGGPIVDAVWRQLLDRAGGEPGTALTREADLHLLADGERVDGTRRTDRRYLFNLPRRPAEVRVVSRAGAPAELGLARDPRQLGVAVRQIRLWHGARLRVLDAADPLLADGFHGFEADNGIRWTDGDASVPPMLFDGADGACEIELLLAGSTQYSLRASAIRWRPRTPASPQFDVHLA